MKLGAIIAIAIIPLIPLTIQAQGHAGHGTPTSVVEKPKAVTTQTQVPRQGQPEQAVQEAPQVEITPELQRRIGVRTVMVAVKPIQKTIRTVGRIEIDERNQATVNTKIEGWIEKLYVDYTGRYVKKGEPLAEIFSPELLATQQEFINTKKWARKQTGSIPYENQHHDAKAQTQELPSVMNQLLEQDAKALLQATRQRLRLWDISEKQIRKIEQTGKPIRTLTLFSPVSGYITQKMAVQGMKVMPGEKLFDIADLSQVWIVADIYEYELSAVRIGQPVKVTLSYSPGREWTARIDYIYPVFSAETRTAKVRMTLPNPEGQLKPQMFTNVVIRVDMGKKLMIPDSAVIDTGRGQVVYVDQGDGIFEPREIETGLKADGSVEVLRGLRAGEKVASSANFLIDSEAQLKGIKPLPNPK
ncbi:MAG: efflux RND transporter periplasmic adaptor subunit [Deltaproteobacteria bacterium HGW-Deltaproteobacteria-10]|jgi:Cu(I)/Ag(I) efflux system membrane fusion protein|nr:MAG: efflux RND transporter periplasmic adaptor subunit [Deltaproteobacteria bacterium HGW-Deltaproteobacteria-10]PKN97479.1 MAG: efflux RND transporter periplasmic adaptor subunit [Chloroflexi bacterium HGW-Chloroflexi-5]